MTVVNALTIDVEDYFHIHAFSDVIRPEDWDSFEPRVERNTYRILDILDSVDFQKSESRIQNPQSRRTRATFFILGWVAERFPTLVKEIHSRGHEVACHGYGHQRIFSQTRKAFEEDVRKSKELLEDITGTEVIGYRAPTYSINKENIWALEVLFELGFRYDSSIFPVKHDFYGFPEAPRFPFLIDFSDGDLLSQFSNPRYLHDMNTTTSNYHPESCALSPAPVCFIEFPISTIRLFGRNFALSGGGYFRLFPYWLTRMGFKHLNGIWTHPAIFYIHPWEVDSHLTRIKSASRLSRFRTYLNLKETENRLKRLLCEFRFSSLGSMVAAQQCKQKATV